MKKELKNQTIVKDEINSENSVKVEREVFISALTLICQRYLEQVNWKEKTIYQLELLHTKSFIEFKSQLNLEDEKQIKPVLKTIHRIGKAEVIDIKIGNCIEEPPLLFNRIDLQYEVYSKYNISFEETSRITEKLYENQFITNPQTESAFINNQFWTIVPKLIHALNERENYKNITNELRKGSLNKRIVNDEKAKDQHGILITDKIPSALSVKEKIIYDMIVFRFLEAVSQESIKEIVIVNLEILHYEFKAEYCRIVGSGWRSIQGNFSRDLIILPELPSLKLGDELKIKQFSINEKKTKPPKLLDFISLLLEMKALGKDEQNEKVIEELVINNYVRLENRFLIPTEKGLKLFGSVYHHNLPIQIEQSNLLSILICPKCKKAQLAIDDNMIKCTEPVCNWMQYRNICGVQLSIKDTENLINNGATTLIKGFQLKSGKKFNAIIKLNKQGESSFVIEQKK